MKTKFFFNAKRVLMVLIAILTIGVAQLWAQSTTYTSSNMSNIGFSNAGACKVVISSTQYDGWKLGSNGNSGSMHFDIPVGTTHLHLHFAGWNNDGASRTLSVSTSVGKFVSGNTSTKSVSLTNDSGVKSSSPFTLATPANASTSYYIDLEMTGVSSAATITIATSSNRAVLWGINALAAASTYTVTYNGNGNTGGSVPSDATAYSSGATVTVKGNTGSLVKTGYAFGGWNTQADGNGTNYAAGSGTFSISANTTLYAKWNPTYTVTYNGNGNTGGSAPTDATAYTSGATVTVKDNTGSLVKSGWTFAGWNTNATGTGTNRAAGSTFSISANTTLYAKWTCTVTWNVNGTTNVYSAQTVTYNSSGSKVTSVPTPDPGDYCGQVFAGWTTAAIDGTQTSAPATLFKTVGDSPNLNSTGSVTFYAVFADYDE